MEEIGLLENNEDVQSNSSADNGDIFDNNEVSGAVSTVSNRNQEQLIECNANGGNFDEFDPLLITEADVKIEIGSPILHADSSPIIDNLLMDDHADCPNIESSMQEYIYDDDVVVLIGRDGIPKPITEKKRKYKLLKQENDPMSGDRPFNDVENGRIYEIDETMVLIPKRVVDKILDWNNNEALRDDVSFDSKVCLSLLVCLVSKEDLSNYRITEDVKEFINGRINSIIIPKYAQCKFHTTLFYTYDFFRDSPSAFQK